MNFKPYKLVGAEKDQFNLNLLVKEKEFSLVYRKVKFIAGEFYKYRRFDNNKYAYVIFLGYRFDNLSNGKYYFYDLKENYIFGKSYPNLIEPM